MSTASAIATATATLQHLLSQATNANLVTTLPPAKARDTNNATTQINLFLYRTEVNTAFSNFPMPGSARANESSSPPLALTLRYLLTSYGQDDDDISGQQIFGESMLALHDHMVLSRQMIDGILPDSELQHQVERVRVTQDPISTDEMTKLWSVFQTDYRLSQTYELSVALLESQRPARTPLPVLKRGANDEGVFVQPATAPPFPCLTEVVFEDAHIDAVAGEVVILQGANLEASQVNVFLTSPRLPDPIVIPAAAVTAERITMQLPAALGGIPAGIYQVLAELTDAGETRVTNSLAISIAPQISNLQLAGATNNRTLTLDLATGLEAGQEAVLLLGSLSYSDSVEIAPLRRRFTLGPVPAGDYRVRLRVDGVDSRLIDRSVAPPAFLNGTEINIP